jgi:hypothetical protein
MPGEATVASALPMSICMVVVVCAGLKSVPTAAFNRRPHSPCV